jgi:hypothetical protein
LGFGVWLFAKRITANLCLYLRLGGAYCGRSSSALGVDLQRFPAASCLDRPRVVISVNLFQRPYSPANQPRWYFS